MKLLVIEYFFLTIVFITLYFIGLKKKKKRGLIPVQDLRHMCNSDTDKILYDGLMRQGIYVRPSLQTGICSIPIALEQYQIAIFSYPARKTAILKRFLLKYKELYLRSAGWKVLEFTQETIQSDFDKVIQTVLSQKKVRTNKKA